MRVAPHFVSLPRAPKREVDDGLLWQASRETRHPAMDAVVSQTSSLQRQQAVWDLSVAATDAGAAWKEVRCCAEGELEMVRSSRETLSVLLAGLQQLSV